MLAKKYDTMTDSRFSTLLSSPSDEKCLWDRAVAEFDDVVVAPTLGSIVPNWLLVIPKVHYLNFRDWSAENASSPYAMLENVASQIGIASDRFIWFEHGANQIGSKAGCGVDHAHLHFIIDPVFSFADFKKQTMNHLPIDWKLANPLACYDEISSNTDYLIFGTNSQAFLVTQNQVPERQFFRKIIAELTGQDNEWDYKEHSFVSNIETTLEAFAKFF